VTVGASYTYLHTNILPGCNCFSMNGSDVQASVGLTPRFAALVEAGATHRGGITPDGYTLTQITYAFGLRTFPLPAARLRPFGESLFGGAHALGSLAPGNNAIGGSSNAIAFLAGGGTELRLGHSFALQPARIDYELTTFHNGQANHQNDIRLSAGVLYRFGSRNK
jgi:peptidoglycan-associated lipoprotein